MAKALKHPEARANARTVARYHAKRRKAQEERASELRLRFPKPVYPGRERTLPPTDAHAAWHNHWREMVGRAESPCSCSEPDVMHIMPPVPKCKCVGVIDHAHCYKCGGACETVSDRMLRKIRARDKAEMARAR